MTKFEINIQETSYGLIVVNADNIEDAREKAIIEYENGNAIWSNSDYVFEDMGGKNC